MVEGQIYADILAAKYALDRKGMHEVNVHGVAPKLVLAQGSHRAIAAPPTIMQIISASADYDDLWRRCESDGLMWAFDDSRST